MWLRFGLLLFSKIQCFAGIKDLHPDCKYPAPAYASLKIEREIVRILSRKGEDSETGGGKHEEI